MTAEELLVDSASAMATRADEAVELGAVEVGVENPGFCAVQDELQPQVNVNGVLAAAEAGGRALAPQHAMVRDKTPRGPANDAVASVADDDGDLACGWGCVRPRWLQQFRTAKWILFWLCWVGGVQGMVVNGFVNVVITTIERRFGLRSSQTGLVAGGYDIASFFCLVPVSYLGGRPGASKPRWLAWGVILIGLGSLLFAAPHFLVGPYRGANHRQNTCRADNSTMPPFGMTECDVVEAGGGTAADSSLFMWLFLLGQLLHGAGAAPLYTLGVTFIDENVSKKMSSVYLGIFYTMAAVGPALGYVVGGQLLQIYTDFLTVDAAEIGLTPLSSVWVGAWWVGFIGAALLCFLLAVPLLAFPVEMPGAAQLRAERVSEAHGDGATTTAAFSKVREMPRAFRALITNPAFFFLNMAGASEGLLLAGFAAFLPKLIENQFSVSASRAALLMGVVTVPAGGGGTFLGGYLVKRFSLNCAAIIKMCILTAAVGFLFMISFIISCPNIAFAGITRGYGDADNATSLLGSPPALGSACNAVCRCDGVPYDPVCGADNVLYYSPCHAGCTKEETLDAARVYSDCACVNAYRAASSVLDSPLERRRRHTTPGEDPEEDGEEGAFQDRADNTEDGVEYDAINEPCSSSCDLLWVFIALAFFTMVATFLITMPALTATLRCVQDEQRSFALGIQWLKVRLLGTIPAPMVFGLLIDATCSLWEEDSCGRGGGSCIAYDNLTMSRYMLALALLAKFCSMLFFFLAWRLYKPPSGLHGSSQEKLEQAADVDAKGQGDTTPPSAPPKDSLGGREVADGRGAAPTVEVA